MEGNKNLYIIIYNLKDVCVWVSLTRSVCSMSTGEYGGGPSIPHGASCKMSGPGRHIWRDTMKWTPSSLAWRELREKNKLENEQQNNSSKQVSFEPLPDLAGQSAFSFSPELRSEAYWIVGFGCGSLGASKQREPTGSLRFRPWNIPCLSLRESTYCSLLRFSWFRKCLAWFVK